MSTMPEDDRADLSELKGEDAGPISTRLRRAGLAPVSGKTSVVVLGFCFLLAAILVIPLAQRLQPWIEAEVVLGTWWLVWIGALAYLLHRGHKISDDHTLGAPRSWLSKTKEGDGWSDMPGCFLDAFDLGSFAEVGAGGEACLLGLLILIAIPLLLVAAWFMVEIAIPAIAFGVYLLLRGMLARVANDRHGCEGNWPRAVLWAGVWATLYIIPQALLVLLVHLIARTPPA